MHNNLKMLDMLEKLYHILGAPAVENFKKILKQNIIKNSPVTIEHVNMAEHIFRKDVVTQRKIN